jgi:GNAT superfamily N-acetyltransferase
MMKLVFATADDSDAIALAALHSAVAAHLTRQFGPGRWSSAPTKKGVLNDLRRPKFSRILIARSGIPIVATLRLATKKPWAIDVNYFTPATKPLYLTGMAVHPNSQRRGVGRLLLTKAEELARIWPADAIRLDAFDADAGAMPFYVKCGFREVARVTYRGNPLAYFELILPPLMESNQ